MSPIKREAGKRGNWKVAIAGRLVPDHDRLEIVLPSVLAGLSSETEREVNHLNDLKQFVW